MAACLHLFLALLHTSMLLYVARAEDDNWLEGIGGLYESNATKAINEMLADVDPRVRPHADGSPVTVNVSIFISSFGSISEMDMEYTMDVYLRERWSDPRMFFTKSEKPMILPPSIHRHVWIPDLFFPNAKNGKFHSVTTPNQLMRVYPNGTIVYSLRLTLTLGCPMVLTHFPMDTQECFFMIESYGHETDDLLLQWGQPRDIEVDTSLTLPRFDLINVEKKNCTHSYSLGKFSCLKVGFSLQRQFGFYLLQTYIPSILIVILSCISFWINMDAVPARITLGVTTVLTMVTQLSGARANLPRVSYPKAIDVWVAACMFFVFGALLEYALVNVLGRRRNRESVYGKGKSADMEENEDMNEGEDKTKFHKWRRYMKSRQAASFVDKASRIVFPIAFLVFNIIYWLVYLIPRMF